MTILTPPALEAWGGSRFCNLISLGAQLDDSHVTAFSGEQGPSE